MELDDLKAFCLVCEHKSLSKAARKLGISTPMMTRRINRLETELKTQLLHRTTRVVEPTETGFSFYQKSQNVLASYEEALSSLDKTSLTVSGTVKIGLPVSLSHLWVTPHVQAFLKQYPEIQVELVNGNHLLGLLSESFDLVIHCSKLPDSGFHYKKIRMWQKVTCASPEYLNTAGTPKHPSELSNHNCCDHYDNFRNTWRYVENGKNLYVFVKGNIKANSSIDLKNLAVSGIGIVYLPEFALYPEINHGKLKEILNEFRPEKQPMYAVYPSKQSLNQKTKIFLEYLSNILTSN